MSTPAGESSPGTGGNSDQPMPPGHVPQWGRLDPTGGGPETPAARQLLWDDVGDAAEQDAGRLAGRSPAPASHARPPLPLAPPPTSAGGQPGLSAAAFAPTRQAGDVSRRARVAIVVVVGLTLLTIIGAAGWRLSAHRTTPGTPSGESGSIGTPTNASQTTGPDLVTTTPGQPTAGDSPRPLPAGYTLAPGPGGVRVPIPSGWTVHSGAAPTNLEAEDPGQPGRFIRFGADLSAPGKALGVVEKAERGTPSIQQDYQRLQLAPTSFGPAGEGVDWEFTFSKSGRARHAYGRYWQQDGRLYVVYLSTWEEDWANVQDVLAVMLNGADAS